MTNDRDEETKEEPPFSIQCIQDLENTSNLSRVLDLPPESIRNVNVQTLAESDPDAIDGVLSKVYQVSIDCDEKCHESFIVKFQRSEPSMQQEPFVSMMEIESNFHNIFPDLWKSKGLDLSFRLPVVRYANSHCILMEKVQDISPGIHSIDSNPHAKGLIGTVLGKVAGLHAAFWNDEVLQKEACHLSPFPGMGAYLNGEQKEEMFTDACEIFCNYVRRTENEEHILGTFTSEERQRFHDICTDFSHRRLRYIHKYVHEQEQFALVHGDLHFGNMLFRRSSSQSEDIKQKKQDIYLIDWATCGRGNPMRDIAFFRILCMDVDEREVIDSYLPQYYSNLCDAYDIQRHHHTNCQQKGIKDTFTLKACQESYDMCILNQFLIFICYHELTESFIHQKGIEEEVRVSRSRHFQGVYRRCIKALLQSYSRAKARFQLPPTI